MTARAVVAVVGLACAAAAAAQAPRTRPERTRYAETSRAADVEAFLAALAARHPGRLHRTSFGYSWEGRRLPLVVWGAPGASAAAVRATGKLRILLVADIHAGEVEGKEAVQVLLREALAGRHPAWARRLVLLVVPLYNIDGNERIALGNRPLQFGPVGGVGMRANAQGLDLNRDHTKLDTPEARALVRLLAAYDPHVVLDLHTTDGTFHAYQLTYAPPLHPSTPRVVDEELRRRWLPALKRALAARGWRLFPYGNLPEPGDTAAPAWTTFDHRPRFLTNLVGLRGRFALLSEAYSYLPFEARVRVTRDFVVAALDYAAAHADRLRALVAAVDAAPPTSVALRARLGPGDTATVLLAGVDTVAHPYTGAPMLRQRAEVRPLRLPVRDRFEPTETVAPPRAYALPPDARDLVARLDAQGFALVRLPAPQRVRAERFRIARRTPGPTFQNRQLQDLEGTWESVDLELPAGSWILPVRPPWAALAAVLLEPRSDDGFAAWGLVGTDGDVYPILRLR